MTWEHSISTLKYHLKSTRFVNCFPTVKSHRDGICGHVPKDPGSTEKSEALRSCLQFPTVCQVMFHFAPTVGFWHFDILKFRNERFLALEWWTLKG